MIKIINRLLNLSDSQDRKRIKLGFLFGFLEALFHSFMFFAVFLILKEIVRINLKFSDMNIIVLYQCTAILFVSVLGQFIFKYLLASFRVGQDIAFLQSKD